MIKILDEQIRNLITAGEVIDRPGAIVKELIENAIDAKAQKISIRITNAGLDSIEVADDGFGMNREDLQLAFLAASTSKINKSYDLNQIKTLGFRGEALAAIGAVSNCEIISNNQEGANKISNRFGILSDCETAARNPGTTVKVSELFYQHPNRLRFLKATDYENALISDLIQKFALSYRNISFSYYNNEHLIFQSNGDGDLEKLIFDIFGSKIYDLLLPLNCSDYDFSISGYISDSHYAKRNKTGINVFINNRLISNTQLTKTISLAYGDYLAKGTYPLVVLNIDTDPQLTDVNISPTKWQIRISKEKQLSDLLTTGIKEVLSKKSSPQQLNIQATEARKPELPNPEVQVDKVIYQQLQLEESPILVKEDNTVIFSQPTVIGQAFGKYIIASFRDELWLIDQHAAMERCNYERFRQALQQENQPEQMINLPPLEVSIAHLQRLDSINKQLSVLGLHFEEYGVNKVLIRSIPLWISQVDIEAFLLDILDYCLANEEVNIAELRKATLASLACHSSIKFNEYLNTQQQNQLVKDLLNCENPYHCPHGRPTIVKLSDKQLAKEFERG